MATLIFEIQILLYVKYYSMLKSNTVFDEKNLIYYPQKCIVDNVFNTMIINQYD